MTGAEQLGLADGLQPPLTSSVRPTIGELNEAGRVRIQHLWPHIGQGYTRIGETAV